MLQGADARAAVRAKCLAAFESSLPLLQDILDSSESTPEKLKVLDLLAKLGGLHQADVAADAPAVTFLSLKGLSQTALDELEKLASQSERRP